MNWDSLMDYGKYKFMKLRNIPASYLVELKRSGCIKYESLGKFIDDNINELTELGDKPRSEYVLEFAVCDKYRYVSEDEAKKHLRQISRYREQREYLKNKIPTRAYQCHICGFYHLTSQPLKTN